MLLDLFEMALGDWVGFEEVFFYKLGREALSSGKEVVIDTFYPSIGNRGPCAQIEIFG